MSNTIQENKKNTDLPLSILDELPNGVLYLEPILSKSKAIIDFRILFANNTIEKICRKSKDQLIGNSFLTTHSSHQILYYYEGFQQVIQKGIPFERGYTVKTDSSEIHYNIKGVKANSNLLVTIDPIHDQSLPKRKGDLKNKQELLERIGRTFAHEIRNPLGGMTLAIDRLKEELSENDSPYIKILETNINRITLLLKEFVFALKGQTLSLYKSSLNEIVNITLETAAETIKLRSVKVTTEVSGTERLLNLDKNKLQIAFLNIIINALEAMEPNTGHLQIKTNWTENSCELSITDNGIGISAQNLQQIFDPFFSLKKSRKGLGLTFVERILTTHDAGFNVISKEGKGTVFSITF